MADAIPVRSLPAVQWMIAGVPSGPARLRSSEPKVGPAPTMSES